MTEHTPGQPRVLSAPRPVPSRPGQRYRALVGSEDGVHELFVSEAVLEPGSGIPLHRHPIVEAFVVLEGTLTFRLGERTLEVGAERTVVIPAGVPHAIANRAAGAARTLTAAPWDHATFFRDASEYLEGVPREPRAPMETSAPGEDEVTLESQQSFPASDAPGWTTSSI